MKDSFRQQFERLALRLAELEATLADPRVAADMKRFRELTREHAEAASLVERFRRYEQRERDLAAAQELLDDADMAEMAREEAVEAQADMERLHAELQTALLPRDPDDARNAFLEIRAGTGGDESALFAGDLARMYLRYAERQGWRCELMSENASELGGYKEVVIRIEGEGVYGRLRFESGGHRVQRVPATEAQGRIHTSACTIAVLAGGVDVLYPPEHADLYDRMTREGLIVAEMPPGTEPGARLFPRRNRIISGLARGVLVVVVDDEPVVAKSTARLLERYGFSTTVCLEPADAYDALARAAPGRRCLLTDVVMPGISGVDLALEARRRFPELPVLLMSGYTGNVDVAASGLECVEKPFEGKHVAQRLLALVGAVAAAP